MTMSPEHIDLHRVVDRLDRDQVRALRAVAQQLLRPSTGHQDAGQAVAPAAESLLADEPHRTWIALCRSPRVAARAQRLVGAMALRPRLAPGQEGSGGGLCPEPASV